MKENTNDHIRKTKSYSLEVVIRCTYRLFTYYSRQTVKNGAKLFNIKRDFGEKLIFLSFINIFV